MSNETKTVTLDEVVAAFRLTRNVDDILRDADLSGTLLAILATLAAHPGEPIGATMRPLSIDPTMATAHITKLEQRGLVTRSTRPEIKGERDRRLVRVALTERGREVLAALATIEVKL